MSTFDNKSVVLTRKDYVQHYGPSTGDRIRLADSNLLIEVEKDYAVYGEEVTVGYAGTPSDSSENSPDLVLANAVILDAVSGVIKADIGIKNGYIIGIGKAGNPHFQSGVNPQLVIGSDTQVIQAAGMIVTAGAVDCYAPSLNPDSAAAALCSGVTTLAGSGLGTVAGGMASTSNLGAGQLAHGLRLLDGLPLNFMLIGKTTEEKGNRSETLLQDGAAGLMLHEQWKSTPASIDTALEVADKHDVPCWLQSDSLSRYGYIDETLAVIKNRATLLVRGSGHGGGHVDNLRAATFAKMFPVSIASSLAYSTDSLVEQADSVRLANGLQGEKFDSLLEQLTAKNIVAAEQYMHDIGALPIIASGNGSPGRIGELARRSWQLAHVMKQQRGPLPEEVGENDNVRVKRYLAKSTINPARALGIAGQVGSIEVGKRADLVLWDPAFFGVRPSTVLVGGHIAASHQGDVAAAVANSQPMQCSPAARGQALTFVSQAAFEAGTVVRLGLVNQLVSVSDTRKITRHNMVLNAAVPEKVEVDPGTLAVTVDGVLADSKPQTALPMSRLYNLF
ncbi:urease subunit alpha [Chromobacterium sp.]|uniref:urease subunit alpha n=1 Tax=Chromobacterium sp. TaxID=306190 RepID=UPI0035AF16E0